MLVILLTSVVDKAKLSKAVFILLLGLSSLLQHPSTYDCLSNLNDEVDKSKYKGFVGQIFEINRE